MDGPQDDRIGHLVIQVRGIGAVIIKKSPEEIEQMAAAGTVLVKTMNLLAGKIRPGVTTGELDRGGRAFHPFAGLRAGLQGLSGISGIDLRIAKLDGGPRDPGFVQARARRHHLA